MTENQKEAYNENRTRRHGSGDFPLEYYPVTPDFPRYVMSLHWHKEAEIIRVKQGALELYINNTPIALKKGDIVFVNCKHLHRADPKGDCVYDCIVFDLEQMMKKSNLIYGNYLYPLATGQKEIHCLLHEDSSLLYETFLSLFTILEQKEEHYPLQVMSTFFCLLTQLFQKGFVAQHPLSQKATRRTATVLELLRWIDVHSGEKITLSGLSRQAGLTPNYLCKLFREYTGKTPLEYVNFIRIQNVCREIRSSHKPITAIAMDNGFNDISYFCKVFKKQVGLPAKKFASLELPVDKK